MERTFIEKRCTDDCATIEGRKQWEDTGQREPENSIIINRYYLSVNKSFEQIIRRLNSSGYGQRSVYGPTHHHSRLTNFRIEKNNIISMQTTGTSSSIFFVFFQTRRNSHFVRDLQRTRVCVTTNHSFVIAFGYVTGERNRDTRTCPPIH